MRPRDRVPLVVACWTGLALLGMGLGSCEPHGERPEPAVEDTLAERLGGDRPEGYARAYQAREFTFPRDHGPHPDFRNEWWYLTGNLESAAGRRFGYQVTFFRIALAPEQPQDLSRRSDWAARQVWMAHVALSDAADRAHREHERFARGALGLAGARAQPPRVWLEDWRLYTDSGANRESWNLSVDTPDFGLDLRLEPVKPIVLQGDDGLSRKSAEPGNASYYYSIPRLRTRGEIEIGDQRQAVAGLSWLDREWSTSALGEDQAGWDWFALQFDDGRDLMFYRLRRKDGGVDPHSAGSLVGPDGAVRVLDRDDVELEPLRWWRSADGVRYPVAWRMRVLDQPGYRVEAVFDDQRMDTSVRYWEGMVDVLDADSRQPIGRGYLELAGYD